MTLQVCVHCLDFVWCVGIETISVLLVVGVGLPHPISSADGGRSSLWDFWPYMVDSVQNFGHNYNIPSSEPFDIE